ncbi:MAG: hypothetical protein ACI4IG_03120 [Eubacterium sp.]
MLKKITVFGITLLILLGSFCCCYAVDLDYLDESKWYHNDKVTTKTVSIKSINNRFEGIYRYFYDKDDNCFYLMVLANEDSIDNSHKDISIEYSVINNYESYRFTVDSNGVVEEEYGNQFIATTSFYTNAEDKTGRYISALDINNGYEINYLTVKIFFNGHSYLLIENFEADCSEEITENTASTTLKNTTETNKTATNATEDKTVKKSTTKFSADVRIANKNKTDKFDAVIESTETATDTDTGYVTSVSQDFSNNNDKGSLSTASKIMMGIASAVGAVGIAYIISSFKVKNSIKTEDLPKDSDDE